ncbi:aspartyl protease family protein [Hymenobacter algoricola]|uniref:aspartyl protease family protein n=1 Tax=Hymenobacter algoricola TaxID=486267 RepID=UPI0031E98ACB
MRRVNLPFALQRNLIIVAVELNGKGPYNFLLDTGVSVSLITDPALRSELKLRVGHPFRVAGAGNEAPLEAFQTDSVRVVLPGIVSPNTQFLVLSEDVLNLSGFVGMPIHGILGSDLFYSFTVVIHPGDATLTFHDPARFRLPRSRRWASLPLDLEGNKAYLTTRVALTDSLTLPLRLVLDTGAGHALSVETSSDPRLRLPATRVRTQLGRGLNGFINGYIGRVPALELGRYRLSSLITSFPDSSDVAMRASVPRNGNIGFEVLKRFDVIIDYTHNRLLLRPNELFHDPFEQDMCGFELLAAGGDLRRYLVTKVEPGSPADLAGIRPDEEIVAINQLPSAIFNLTQISRIFHSGDGRLVLLFLRRPDGTLYTTMVRLKRQI